MCVCVCVCVSMVHCALVYGDLLVSVQVDRDVMIWNNKMWKNKPLFMKEESMMVKHRRWYSQFYSKNSPKLKDIIHNSNGFDW